MTAQNELERLLEQEQRLRFDRFNHASAWQIGTALKKEVEATGGAVAIEIYAFGQVLFSYAMAGTCADHQHWLCRKRQAVLRFAHSSLYLGAYNRSRQRVMEDMSHLDASEYCSHGGAFPILLRDGGVIGVIGVSGLAQEEDHGLIIKVLEAVITD